ncbi:heparinase II/III-family protein [Membranicola marinus]|uniref:Heparinase II/III-family protein n=1 Tax=Membranihabitans marinus TaxID=1227546 RepID=A0A953HUU3_9BACT|nr:heparinase II/III family protein [Membranihabitans marinus]MBY5956911.1 heparinase II/III-family protein [Membranihabitans marinus]
MRYPLACIKNILAFLIIVAGVNIAKSNIFEVSMDSTKLENPFTVDYLEKNIRKESPRLVLTPEIAQRLQADIQSDPVIGNVYQAIRLNADKIMSQPLLERIMTGRRLLHVSREMLYRMNILGMVYQMEKDEKILNRIDEELKAVIHFTDWNPSHYLDVAEMALAVAIGLDWTEGDLPSSTIDQAKLALIEKGIKPSYNKKGNTGWITGNNNWNQVCNGGMIAASILTADVDPELAARTIHRSIDGIPHALKEYGPDGVYPEGATYWGYGTTFSVVTVSLLESAFGTDYGLGDFPAFKESALFVKLSEAPSGMYYNFADCGDRRKENGNMTLAWFAKESQDALFYEKDRFLRDPAEMGKLNRMAGAGLVWLSQYEGEEKVSSLPASWQGDGANPLVFFRDDQAGFYFGGKGGSGTVNHGNMDAGSFVFELDGVRWVIDPGNQSYHALEKTGFNLWGRCQECERWTLLTKNNYGHSTLTVNDQLHVVDGKAEFVEYQKGSNGQATLDLSPVFAGQLEKATRRFSKEDDRSLVVTDDLILNDSTRMVTWQLMTTAEVESVAGGAILHQDGQALQIENVSHPAMGISVVQLDPPPLELDRRINNLKRLEFRYPAWQFKEGKGEIKVRLRGM